VAEDLLNFTVQLMRWLCEPDPQHHARLHRSILAQILHLVIEGSADHVVLVPRDSAARAAIVCVGQVFLEAWYLFRKLRGPPVFVASRLSIHFQNIGYQSANDRGAEVPDPGF
jgi:hypothetical protein